MSSIQCLCSSLKRLKTSFLVAAYLFQGILLDIDSLLSMKGDIYAKNSYIVRFFVPSNFYFRLKFELIKYRFSQSGFEKYVYFV